MGAMRIRNSIAIFKASWGVIRDDRELLWLPVISAIATLAVVVSFGVPVVLTGSDSADGFRLGAMGWVVAAAGYFVAAYVTIFFNAALVSAAHERLSGGDPTLGSALAGARRRAATILPWALLSASVSLFLRAVSERSGIVGRIVVGIIGMAWSLVTFLVLPILVVENVGVGEAVRRSASMFKRTWGENVMGQGGVGLVGFLAVLAGVPVLVLALLTGNAVVAGLGAVVFALWVGVVMVVTSALSGVYQTALYLYASTGELPRGYEPEAIRGAFAARPVRAGSGGLGGFGGGLGGGGFSGRGFGG